MDLTTEEIRQVNKTNRTNGAIGRKAKVPAVVRSIIQLNGQAKVLDYGAGKAAIHAVNLRNCGFSKVTAWDIGDNFVEGVHDSDALSRKYNIVYASNVLNVLPSQGHIRDALDEIKMVLTSYGIAVVNYPKSPRKADVSLDCVKTMLRHRFPTVFQEDTVFICLQT